MSDINDLILEDINNLKPYIRLHSFMRKGETAYNRALKCHSIGDSQGFMNQMAKHHQLMVSLHRELSKPKTFFTNGQHVSNRRKESSKFLNDLLGPKTG